MAASLAAIFIAVAPASGRRPGVRVVAVGGEHVVTPGSATFTAVCPASAPHPAGSEVGALTGAGDGQIVLSESYPVGRRGWRISVVNVSDKPYGFYAAVVCLAADAKFSYPRETLVAEPQKPVGDLIKCPRSAPTPIASVFQLQPGSPQGGAIAAAMSQTYNRRGVANAQLGAMTNLTDQPIGVTIGAVCSSLRVTTQQASATVSPGKVDGFTFRCRRGEFAVGGAFFPNKAGLFPDLALVDSFQDPGRRWAVGVKDLGTAPIRYVVADVCVG